MYKRKINASESISIKKEFGRNIKKSFFYIFLILLFSSAFIYSLAINWIDIILVKILLFLLIFIVAFILISSVYSIINIYKKIKNKVFYRISSTFSIQKKQIRSGPTSDISPMYNEDYYELYLKNDHTEKGIRVSKHDYFRIKENDKIIISYFDTVDILINVFYNNEELKDVRFFSINKWKDLKKLFFI